MDSHPSERRATRRVRVDFAIRLRIAAAVLDGRLRDLSRMGGLVIVSEPIARGAVVSLEIELPDRSALTLRGQVVRMDVTESSYGIGVLFGPMMPAVLAQIESIIAAGN